MAASSEKNDDLFKQIMDNMEGDMKELTFLDQAIDYVRRNSTFLVVPTAGTKVKKLVNKHVATAKEDFDKKRREEGKKAAERGEIPEVEEITLADLDPVPVADLKKQKEENKKKKEKKKKAAPKKKEKESEDKKTEEEEEEEDDSPPPIGNGGEGPGYVWTQTLEEIEIRCEVPSTIRGKHLDINLGKNKMRCGIKRQPADALIEGEWHAEIQDSLWTLETERDKKFLVISIEKYKGMCWWPVVIKGHPEINTKKIQPENSKLESLDGETRQTVEKMMFDQRQKAMGKPTSKEQSQQDKLKKFMAMHPEMDFSQAKFGGGMDGGASGMGNMFGGMN